MIKKHVVSIILIIMGIFLAWYLYQEYKKTQNEIIIVATSAQESL